MARYSARFRRKPASDNCKAAIARDWLMFLVILIPVFVLRTFTLLVGRSADAFLLFVVLTNQKTCDSTAQPRDDGPSLARDRDRHHTLPVQ